MAQFRVNMVRRADDAILAFRDVRASSNELALERVEQMVGAAFDEHTMYWQIRLHIKGLGETSARRTQI